MKKLYASTIMKSKNTIERINYYKTMDEKYGIEIEKQINNSNLESKQIKNITSSKVKINKVLDFLTEKFVMPDTVEYVLEDLRINNR